MHHPLADQSWKPVASDRGPAWEVLRTDIIQTDPLLHQLRRERKWGGGRADTDEVFACTLRKF